MTHHGSTLIEFQSNFKNFEPLFFRFFERSVFQNYEFNLCHHLQTQHPPYPMTHNKSHKAKLKATIITHD